jgi:hypothetical protein
MKRFNALQVCLTFMMLILSVFLITGCGSNGQTGHWLPSAAPTVTAVVPLNAAVGVAINTKITATFSKDMDPSTITGTTFTVVNTTLGGTAVAGNVTYDATSKTATFTPTIPATLPVSTLFTATITTGAMDLEGNALVSNYVWTFTTGLAPDTIKPRVTVTFPATTIPGPTPGVPTNTAITATFTKNMAPATLISPATSFTLTCAPACVYPSVTGTVSYAVASKTAKFKPTVPAVLEVGKTYTATIKGTGASPVTDLAGNALAGNQAALPASSDYIWTFNTVAPPAPSNVSVGSTIPAPGTVLVCPNASVNATFTVPSGLRMDPLTVDATTFTLTGPGLTPVTAASVSLDVATGRIATFTPSTLLVNTVVYTATIKGGVAGVTDLAGNTMLADYTWTFTAGPATGACVGPPALGLAATFGTFGGTAGMTNTGIQTIIDGDIGTIATATSTVTGFHDSLDIYTETPANIGAVGGTIYTCTNSTTGPNSAVNLAPATANAANCALATQARLDAQTAYGTLVAMPSTGPLAGNLAGLTITPGVYTNATSVMIQGPLLTDNLTLDALGDANAVFVFQIGTTLTVGGPGAAAPRSIILAGGAQAKNVFWQVGSFATINAAGGGTMVGTIISQTGASFSTVGNTTIVTLEGRVLSLGASVTLVDTIINVPLP